MIALVMRIQSWHIAIGVDEYLLSRPSYLLMRLLDVNSKKPLSREMCKEIDYLCPC